VSWQDCALAAQSIESPETGLDGCDWCCGGQSPSDAGAQAKIYFRMRTRILPALLKGSIHFEDYS